MKKGRLLKGQLWERGTGKVKKELFLVISDEFFITWLSSPWSQLQLAEVYLLDSESRIIRTYVDSVMDSHWRLVSDDR